MYAIRSYYGQSGVGIVIGESRIPVRSEVNSACEFLGLDPLYVANEGKLVAICAAGEADALRFRQDQGVDFGIVGRRPTVGIEIEARAGLLSEPSYNFV